MHRVLSLLHKYEDRLVLIAGLIAAFIRRLQLRSYVWFTGCLTRNL
jgi:hypothetical protein